MLATHYQFGTQRYLPVSSSSMLGWKVCANMLSWSPVSLAENWNCIIVCTSEAYEEWTKQFTSIIASIKAVAATCYHCNAYFNARHTLRSDYLWPGWIHIYSYSQRKTRQKITPWKCPETSLSLLNAKTFFYKQTKTPKNCSETLDYTQKYLEEPLKPCST